MKSILIIFGILVSQLTQVLCQKNDALIGKIVEIPNPCLAEPCLPGLLYAINDDYIDYVITIKENWQWVDKYLIINNDTLKTGEHVKLIGSIFKKLDTFEDEYYEIEVDSVNILTSIIWQNNNAGISINLDPNDCSLFVKANGKQLHRIEIINLEGKIIFSSEYNYSENTIIRDINAHGLLIVKVLFNDNYFITKKIFLK